MPTFYPRAHLHLVIRFDEFGDSKPLKKSVPKKSTRNIDGIKVERTPLQPTIDTSVQNVERWVLLPPGESVTDSSPVQRTKSADGLTQDVIVIPKKMTVSLNGIRTANTLRATLRYIDAPFDPRLLRAVGVEGYLGCIDEDQAAEEGEHGPSGTSLPETWTDSNGIVRTNRRFEGFVDIWEADHHGTDESIIELECTDYTGLFRDQEAIVNHTLDETKPIDEAIAIYLSNYVQFAGITVEYRPQEDERPILKKVFDQSARRINLGPSMAHGSGAVGSKLSVWDYLYDICASIGHSLYVDGRHLIIQRAKSVFESLQPRVDDPYRGRVVDGQTLNYRRMVYGHDVQRFKPRRNFTKHVPPNFEVRSYCSSRKVTLVGRFPTPSTNHSDPKNDSQLAALPGNNATDQKWCVIWANGISDEKTLRAIAEEYYVQWAKQELGVEITTKRLASLGGDNSDPDLLDIKFGDTIDVLVDKTVDHASTLTAYEKISEAHSRLTDFLKVLGYDDEFAQRYADAYTNAGFTTQFRVKTARFDWTLGEDDEAGIKVTADVVNYVAVRANKVLPSGEEPSNTKQANT